MVFDGLSEDDLESDLAQNHWRNTTSEYIQKFWDSENHTSTFLFSEVLTNIKRRDTIIRRALRYVEGGSGNTQRRRASVSMVRIGYHLEFTIRGSEETAIPDEILSKPFEKDFITTYVTSLKNDDPTENAIFENVQIRRSGLFVEPSTPPSSLPSASPTSLAPSLSPSVSLFNAESKTVGLVNNLMIMGLVILGAVSLVVILKPSS